MYREIGKKKNEIKGEENVDSNVSRMELMQYKREGRHETGRGQKRPIALKFTFILHVTTDQFRWTRLTNHLSAWHILINQEAA